MSLQEKLLNIANNVPKVYNAGYNKGLSEVGGKEEQEKTISITENGTTEVTPDEGKVLSKVTVNTNVESGGGSGEDTLMLRLKNELLEYECNEAVQISESLFRNCTALIKASFPQATSASANAFNNCGSLTYVDLGNTSNLAVNVLYACHNIKTIIIRSSVLCTLAGNINANGISRGYAWFYVPRALIEDYKVATNWTNYANQFRALEDFTVDGTTTGAFDGSKI